MQAGTWSEADTVSVRIPVRLERRGGRMPPVARSIVAQPSPMLACCSCVARSTASLPSSGSNVGASVTMIVWCGKIPRTPLVLHHKIIKFSGFGKFSRIRTEFVPNLPLGP